MSIRIIVTTADALMAANVGGPVSVTHRSFEVDAPELEAFMAEQDGWSSNVRSLCQRTITGVEIVSEPKP